MNKKILFSLSMMLVLSACSKTAKRNLGLTEDMPDELQVKKVKPLEVPPHFDPNYKPVNTTSVKEVELKEKLATEEKDADEAKPNAKAKKKTKKDK